MRKRRWKYLYTIIGFGIVLSVILANQLLTQKNKVGRAILMRGDPFPGARKLRESARRKPSDE